MVKGAKPKTPRKRAGTAPRRGAKHASKSTHRSRVERQRLVHEIKVHEVELELKNEELRSARTLLEAALERYTEVFDFAPIGYAVLDPDGAIMEINHAGATLLGDDRARLIGRLFRTFMARTSRSELDRLLRDTVAFSTPMRSELEIMGKAGALPVRITAGSLLRGERGIMLAYEDISERRAKEAELLRTESALRDANARKDEFFAMLSHELRNPLTPIRSSVSILQVAPPGSEAARSALTIIDRSAVQLTRLVDDLLDVARIARGKVALHREIVDVTALVKETVAEHEVSCAARGLELTVTLAPEPVFVHGDHARLVQVLTNLLANAEKFTPARGRLDVNLEATGSSAILTVSDTGIGVSPDVLEHVFEPFTQAPQPLDRSLGGLGLGLAMVRSIVELHGGRASIRSEGLGRGTAVTVVLPREEIRAPVPVHVSTRAAPVRKVLVVEDKLDAAEALRFALTLKGHDVAVAHTGRSAVELAEKFGPDVILCDLGLPDMNGYEVARTIRRSAVLREIWLVALSGYAQAEDVALATDAGFDRHIAKPPSLEDIDQVLATAAPRPPQST